MDLSDRPETPRIYALPCGTDFAAELATGILARLDGEPPEALARVTVITSNARIGARVRETFRKRSPLLLPRVLSPNDLGGLPLAAHLPQSVPSLRRRLELVQLVTRLLDAQPDLGARSSAFGLADSLANLMGEMEEESVPADSLRELDVADVSGHWARARKFLDIALEFVGDASDAPSDMGRMRMVINAARELWRAEPPADPVIFAGSSTSRGSRIELAEVVANLPAGAVVIPGFDRELPARVWKDMIESVETAPGDDHPQFRYARLMKRLEIGPADIKPWTEAEPAASARNRLVSLSLRPAPVTDAWIREGPELSDLESATEGLSLVEARSPREEALAIAIRLRQAIEDRQRAAFVSSDPRLVRQVKSALQRWNVEPDDSAGMPLSVTTAARFLRMVSWLPAERMDTSRLLSLLKHPICHSGSGRREHLRLARALEIRLRDSGVAYPDASSVRDWAEEAPRFGIPDQDGGDPAAAEDGLEVEGKGNSDRDIERDLGRDSDPEARRAPLSLEKQAWAEWLIEWILPSSSGKVRRSERLGSERRAPLATLLAQFRARAEALAGGSRCHSDAPGALWDGADGQVAANVLKALEDEAESGGDMSAAEFADLFKSLLATENVRSPVGREWKILVCGPREIRAVGADLLVLGGLNEGSWPLLPPPDPWLNRPMRKDAGLLPPERRIGLAAHDFQQGISAREVLLVRSLRSNDAETVASRWLNRLTNLLSGLEPTGGKRALEAMRDRGRHWLGLARLLESPIPAPPAPRPSPKPPVEARPRRLSVTQIKTLVRDPYAIYASKVLRLVPLGALVRTPDPLTRGIAIHEILERAISEAEGSRRRLRADSLMKVAREVLESQVPWHSTRALWAARLERVAAEFMEEERNRQADASPVLFEAAMEAEIAELGFVLHGKADRIDRAKDGRLRLYDYKTGTPPSRKAQESFDKQLLLEVAMAERGGIPDLPGTHEVELASYLGVGSALKEVEAPIEDHPPSETWADLAKLVAAYLQPDQGFTSRRAMQKDSDKGGYDHLARHGEWDRTSESEAVDLS